MQALGWGFLVPISDGGDGAGDDCLGGDLGGGYLGDDRSAWQRYDACALIAGGAPLPPTLVDQGGDDAFLERELNIPLLEQTLADAGAEARVRMQAGYDHSYFFIASFIDAHIAFHAEHLAAD
ncbi:MAG: hypothetical protein AAGF75_03775 [Cyanobacteria bacterium P01_H01_bin.130]